MSTKTVAPVAEQAEKQELSFEARLAIAYEHYRYVNQDQIATFNERLKKQTIERWTGGHAGPGVLMQKYDVLDFSPWQEYPGDPGADVRGKAEVAEKRGIFDVLEVAKIKSEVEYLDPILFGRIKGCGDRFFIAQWDDDVKIEDIIGPNEG